MVIYYAMGGGFGHLSRAKKVLMTLGTMNYKVISTAHPFSSRILAPDKIVSLPDSWHKTPEKVMGRIEEIIRQYSASRLIVDTFPYGLLGELDLNRLNRLCDCDYVARYLNWEAYLPKIKPTGNFKQTFLVDSLSTGQKNFIHHRSSKVSSLNLSYQIVHYDRPTPLPLSQDRENWLIVHSYPRTEVLELLYYAQQIASLEERHPRYIISSPCADSIVLENKELMVLSKQYAPPSIFEKVDRIFTACGYNLMQETLPYKEKHHFLPFTRKYDNQFLRASRRKSSL